MQESEKELLNRTSEWIKKQGYPLEMRAAKALSERGFDVRQSQLYVDDQTKKAREIDLLALYPDYLGIIQITLNIECKSSPKPWILLSTDSGSAGLSVYWTYALMSQSAREALSDAASIDSTNPDASIEGQFGRLKWLQKSTGVAYSLRQAFTDTDTAYAALTSSIKSASHAIRRKSTTPDFRELRFAFPLVIVDAPMFLCKLNTDLNLTLEPVESGEVVFTNPSRREDTTCIRVVTIGQLPNFLDESKREFFNLSKELRPAEERIWQEHFTSPLPRFSAEELPGS